MPDFENSINNEQKLPWLLTSYFRSKQEFLSRVGSEYRRLKEIHSGIDPFSIGFVEVLIGKDEVYDLSPDERKIFLDEVQKVINEIEKKRRDMQNHWNEEAKRAGFIGEGEVTKNGVEFSGGGSDLERHLKEN